ncbi:MAG: two-component system phosphate regulon response regulator OmpR [Myxococcota bacterium]|jgi:two-component system phosphate regulon response regulator OmpR
MKEKTPQILVIDDDTRLRNLLIKYLGDNGFEVLGAKDTADAREILKGNTFDILIVDMMMPNENGLEFTKYFRTVSNTPILMLTAKGNSSDRIDGLEAGADDYMPKPFEPKELLLRINNILKRSVDYVRKNTCEFGDFAFCFDDSRLKKNDVYLHITESEAKILSILCQNLGNTVSREKIAKECGDVDARSIDVQITRFRRKIEENPKQPHFLQTIRNQGYVLHK